MFGLRKWMLDNILQPIIKEMKTMSTTISQQQDANTAALTNDLGVIKAGIATLQQQLAAASGSAGDVLTQAQEDAFTAARTTADAMAAALEPPTPPAA